MRITVGMLGTEPDMGKHLGNTVGDLAPRRHAVQTQRILQRPAHGLAGIERGVRVLEHDLGDARKRLAAVCDLARHRLPVKRDAAAGQSLQADDGERHRRLAAAGLAD